MPGIWGARNANPPATTMNSSSGHSLFRRVAPGRYSGSAVLDFASPSRRAIGGLTSARRPSRSPIAAATTHQPTEIGTIVASEDGAAESTVTITSAVAAAALSRTVALRKSTKCTPLLQQRLEQPAHTALPVDYQVGLLDK